MKKFNDYINESKVNEAKIDEKKSKMDSQDFDAALRTGEKLLNDALKFFDRDDMVDYVEITDDNFSTKTYDIFYELVDSIVDAKKKLAKLKKEMLKAV
jgi:hypothetical protein